MAALIARLSLLCLLSLSVSASLIRVQPYGGTGLNPVIASSEDCPAPCFLGLPVSQILQSEAAARLAQHQWIDHLIEQSLCYSWAWNGAQPSYLVEQYTGGHRPLGLYPMLICPDRQGGSFNQGAVTLRGVTLGQLILEYGEPSHMAVNIHRREKEVAVLLVFEPLGYIATSLSRCPLTRDSLWKTEAQELYTMTALARSYYNTRYDLGRLMALPDCSA